MSSGDLLIASYNIRKALGTDRRRNPERVARVIGAVGADVVILQEADHRLSPRPAALSRDLVGALGLRPVEAAGSPVSLGWHGIAILIRPEISVTAVSRLDLPGLEPRGALIADLASPQGPIRVAGVHLGLLRRSRRAQLSFLLRHLDARGVLPTVVGGDFNEWSRRVGLGRLAHHFALHAPGRSFHARHPIAALDRFATNAGAHVVEMGVHDAPPASMASDHLPIWGRFRLYPEFARRSDVPAPDL